MSFFIKSLVQSVIVISFLTASISVQAHNHHNNNDKKPNDMKSLVDQFHHEIEHSEDETESSKVKALFSQWLENFNLVRVSLDTHRWTQMKYYQDSGKSEYIRNFPVLASFYFLSHTMEMFSGPVGVYAASQAGMSHGAQAIIGTIGAIISIPGLDPLCMLLFVVSPLKPVQRVFSGIRIVAVKVSNVASDKFHLQEAASKILDNKDRINEIINNSFDASVSTVYDVQRDLTLKQMTIVSSEGKPYLNLNFQSENNKTWVDSVEVLDAKILSQNQKSLDRIIAKFNVSVRYALKKAIQKPRKTFYTESVAVEGSSTKIQFKDYALLLKPKIHLKDPFQNEMWACKTLFQ